MRIRKIKKDVYLCLLVSFIVLSCSRKTSKGTKELYTVNKVVADSCSTENKLTDGDSIQIDSSKVKVTTWGVHFCGSNMFGNKDNSVKVPALTQLYTSKQYAYCKNDSCNSGYYVIGLRCPSNLWVKRWVSTQIWKEMKEDGDKKISKLSIRNSTVSDKQIADFYLKNWKKHYDHYLNHQLLCERTSTKYPTEQFGLYIVDVWKNENYCTMCVHSWYDMASCGDNSQTSFYTINSANGKVLALKDILFQKDYSELEILLKKKLVWEKRQKNVSQLQSLSFLKHIDGIALVKEGLLIYFYPYNIGYGYEGQYNIIFPYEQLKENGISLRTFTYTEFKKENSKNYGTRNKYK